MIKDLFRRLTQALKLLYRRAVHQETSTSSRIDLEARHRSVVFYELRKAMLFLVPHPQHWPMRERFLAIDPGENRKLIALLQLDHLEYHVWLHHVVGVRHPQPIAAHLTDQKVPGTTMQGKRCSRIVNRLALGTEKLCIEFPQGSPTPRERLWY